MVPSSLWLLQFLMTNCIHLLWYVATPIDLAENFLFQGFIHQPVWIRRTFNGEFIMMRNLWVAVIKCALAFIESFITHPLLLKTIDTRLTLLPLLCNVCNVHPNTLFDSFQRRFIECLLCARYCANHGQWTKVCFTRPCSWQLACPFPILFLISQDEFTYKFYYDFADPLLMD